MQPVIDSLPNEWEVVIWDNGERMVSRSDGWAEVCSDLSVYGRYAAIEHASNDVIFVVDDDVIVSDPQAIVNEWMRQVPILGEEIMQRMKIRESLGDETLTGEYEGHVVCNMPPEFRHDGYTDSALVGFGACFHRDAPKRAFAKFHGPPKAVRGSILAVEQRQQDREMFHRTCDVVFTALTPRVLVNVEKQDREFASDPNRMWKQQGHLEERQEMLRLARRVRDA